MLLKKQHDKCHFLWRKRSLFKWSFAMKYEENQLQISDSFRVWRMKYFQNSYNLSKIGILNNFPPLLSNEIKLNIGIGITFYRVWNRMPRKMPTPTPNLDNQTLEKDMDGFCWKYVYVNFLDGWKILMIL